MANGSSNLEDNWNEELQTADESGPRMSDGIGYEQSGNPIIANEMELDDSDAVSELSEMSYSSTGSADFPESDLSTPPDFDGFASLDDSDMDEDVDIDIGSVELESVSENANGFESYTPDMGDEQSELGEVNSVSDDEVGLINLESASDADLGANAELDESEPEPGDEASAAQPSVDLSNLYSDWRTMWQIFLLYEQSSNELVRLLQLLQSVVRLFEQSEQQLLTPPPSPSADGDIWATNSWTFYRQQVDDLLRIARHFARLIQMQLRGDFFE